MPSHFARGAIDNGDNDRYHSKHTKVAKKTVENLALNQN